MPPGLVIPLKMRELFIASAPAAIALARIIPAFFSQREISLPDDSAAACQISVAIVSTKIPALLRDGLWGFSLMKAASTRDAQSAHGFFHLARAALSANRWRAGP